MTAARGTGQCKMPLMVQADATAIYNLTFQLLHSVIAWSFNCALTGLHPRRGPTRKRFEDRQRRRLAGQKLAGGFKLVYVMFGADWKAEVDTFHLEHHYNMGVEMCHLCWATKEGELSYCQPCNNPCFDHPRRNDDYMASRSAAMSPLTGIAGFHSQQVLPDAMHVGPLGIFLVVAGSVLWDLCQEGCFGLLRQAPRWQDDLSMRLKQAYSGFCVFVQSKGCSCSQRCFTPGRLSMKTLRSAPALKAKAANAIVVVEWLADDCAQQAAAAPDIDYYSDRATMLWGLTSIFKIWRESPTWLSQTQRRALLEPRDAFFGLYVNLSLQAAEFERPLYGMIPKLHMLDHLVRICCETGLNPCSFWVLPRRRRNAPLHGNCTALKAGYRGQILSQPLVFAVFCYEVI